MTFPASSLDFCDRSKFCVLRLLASLCTTLTYPTSADFRTASSYGVHSATCTNRSAFRALPVSRRLFLQQLLPVPRVISLITCYVDVPCFCKFPGLLSANCSMSAVFLDFLQLLRPSLQFLLSLLQNVPSFFGLHFAIAANRSMFSHFP